MFNLLFFYFKDFNSAICTYDLTAVICHHGTVCGGHYTCYARHETKGKWYEYDDQLVTEVSEEDVQRCEAYVLFYRKVNPQMAVLRARASQLLDMCAETSASDIRFFVSKQWLNKFYTFAEPGPIDNWALLCPHGALPPNKAPIKSQLVVALPQPLWDYMYRQFGGGPACNHLYECDVCRRAAEELSQRQTLELEAFQQYKDETTATIYAISMTWLRQWQLFVGGDGANDDPGPINNTSIAGHIVDGNEPIRSVRSGSDYAQINSTLWRFFYGVYGGGPVIILRGLPEEIPALNKKETVVDTSDIRSAPEIPVATIEAALPSPSKPCSVATDMQPPVVEKKSKKVVKNVSFEDDGELLENSSISSTVSSSAELVNVVGQRNKSHRSASTTVTEIVNKKDKRHRGGITTNGLFGPEGKSCHILPYNYITSKFAFSFMFSGLGKYSDNSLYMQQPTTSVGGSLNPSPPLTNHTKSIHPKKTATASTDGDVGAEQMIDLPDRKAHKSRKKIKIKSIKKQVKLQNSHHNHHQSESDRSDSDR